MYLDIPHNIRSDGEFRHKVLSLVKRISQLEDKAKTDPGTQTELSQTMIDLYHCCNQNAGLLVPYFFPKYPFDEPLSLHNRPFSYAMLHMQRGGSMTIRASRQIGKPLGVKEPVLTESGWREIGKLEIGDRLLDGEGFPTKVTNIYRHGPKQTYRLHLADGNYSRCCEDHLWPCSVGGESQILETQELGMLLEQNYPVTLSYLGRDEVELVGVETDCVQEVVCIKVDSPTSTFVTRGHLITHNSTSFIARQLIHAHMLPGWKSMYVVPHPSFLDTYANRMRDMERAFRFHRRHPEYRQNLKFKEYPNRSEINLIKCLTDTSEARSKTTDELLFDECQLLDTELLPDIEQCQKASRMPVTLYAGTSTTMDSFLETNYHFSSQGVWVIPAPGFESKSVGKGWLNCGDQEDVIAGIQPEGFCNPATGQQLRVEDGQWVHKYQFKLDAGFIGFHIPQVIIPEYVNRPEKWQEIIEAHVKYRHNMKKFIQEILGIPTEEGQREITQKDLVNMCDPDLTTENVLDRIKRGYYSHVISGCDWGGSDYNPASRIKASYTVHAMLGIAPDNKVDILMMKQYSGMDYQSIIKEIVRDHEVYAGGPIGTDFGVGAAYNMLLRDNDAINATRHFIFSYVGPKTVPISQPKTGPGWYNQFSVNRTESISSLYQAIKSGELRCYNWHEAQDRLLEFLNLYRIPVDSAGGAQTFRYDRHGARPDDSLHAVNFAFIIAQLIRGVPIVTDASLKREIENNLGLNSYGASTIWGWPDSGHISG